MNLLRNPTFLHEKKICTVKKARCKNTTHCTWRKSYTTGYFFLHDSVTAKKRLIRATTLLNRVGDIFFSATRLSRVEKVTSSVGFSPCIFP